MDARTKPPSQLAIIGAVRRYAEANGLVWMRDIDIVSAVKYTDLEAIVTLYTPVWAKVVAVLHLKAKRNGHAEIVAGHMSDSTAPADSEMINNWPAKVG